MSAVPRSELVTLFEYLRTGSHKGAAHRLGISESTSRQRISRIIRALGVANVTQAAWVLHDQLALEAADAAETFVRHQHGRSARLLRGSKRRLP